MTLRIGVMLPSFRDRPDEALAAGVEADQLGLDGLFLYDHLWPMGAPERPALAPFPLLGALAETTTASLGTLVARIGLVPEETLIAQFTALDVLAPAKINLYLHVVGRRADGYHLLDSLIAFADVGDRLEAQSAPRLSLSVGGAEAGPLADIGDDNLVLRAARLLAAAAQRQAAASTTTGAAFYLDKMLPVSSGIGGGSSDAAAALRLLNRLWNRPLASAALAALGPELGADVPACLAGRPVWVGGIGERLDPANGLPEVGIVLANPRRPLATPEVFRARSGGFSAPGRFAPMPRDAAGLAAVLAQRRNDLTEPALHLMPEIARVLDRLARLPDALLARMSGSGASCFALFADRAAAEAGRALLSQEEPGWWIAAGGLLTEPPAIATLPERPPA